MLREVTRSRIRKLPSLDCARRGFFGLLQSETAGDEAPPPATEEDAALQASILHRQKLQVESRNGNAERGAAVLKQMYDAYKAKDCSTADANAQQQAPDPNVYHFSVVLQAWTKSKQKDAANRAERLLLQMEQMDQSGDLPNVKPNAFSINAVLTCWSKAGVPQRSEELMRSMERRFSVQPNAFSYSSVIDGYASKANVAKCESLMDEMMMNSTRERVLAPDRICFHSVLKGWSRTSAPDAAERAEALMRRMEALANADQDLDPDRADKTRPDLNTYGIVIAAWRKEANRMKGIPKYAKVAAKRADSLLAELVERSLAEESLKPNRAVYTAVIGAHASAGNPKRCSELLDEMHAKKDEFFAPSPQTYLTVVQAWAKHEGGAERAEEVLRMIPKGDSKGPHVACYTAVLDAYAKAGNAPQAQRILDEMEVVARERKDKPTPLLFNYNTVLTAWARDRVNPDSSNKLQALFHRLQTHVDAKLHPDVRSYAVLMDDLANRGDVASCQALLTQMESLYSSGNAAVKPNLFSYNAMMKAWSKSEDPNAAHMSHDLLQKMIHCGDATMAPDKISYSMVLNGWAKHGHATHCEELLGEMAQKFRAGDSKVEPDLACYAILLKAWARSKADDARERLEGVLQLMEQSSNSNLTPNTQCYNTALAAFAERGDGERCDAMLRKMEDSSKAKPDVVSYQMGQKAWSRSSDARATERIDVLGRTMKALVSAT